MSIGYQVVAPLRRIYREYLVCSCMFLPWFIDQIDQNPSCRGKSNPAGDPPRTSCAWDLQGSWRGLALRWRSNMPLVLAISARLHSGDAPMGYLQCWILVLRHYLLVNPLQITTRISYAGAQLTRWRRWGGSAAQACVSTMWKKSQPGVEEGQPTLPNDTAECFWKNRKSMTGNRD